MKIEQLRACLSSLQEAENTLYSKRLNRQEQKAQEHIWNAERLIEDSLKEKEATEVKSVT